MFRTIDSVRMVDEVLMTVAGSRTPRKRNCLRPRVEAVYRAAGTPSRSLGGRGRWPTPCQQRVALPDDEADLLETDFDQVEQPRIEVVGIARR